MISPVTIAFDEAIAVASFGVLVNGASVLILSAPRNHHHHPHDHHHHHDQHGGDHNLRGAYLHVLADSLTTLMAILALVMARYFGWLWIDPAMGVVGAVLIARWSWGLLSDSARVQLDKQAPEAIRNRVRTSLEGTDGDRIADLHVWSVGPGIYAADVSLVSHAPQSPNDYRRLIPQGLGIVHATIEVHRCTATAA